MGGRVLAQALGDPDQGITERVQILTVAQLLVEIKVADVGSARDFGRLRGRERRVWEFDDGGWLG
ncbi:hypothetical protein RS3R2_44840 [Pseudomonas lactis]|nr:hypothetical protein RS3R2_44840 [Pseudomonas lactis]